MPAQDQSSKIGTSSSPAIQQAIDTGKCSQEPRGSVADALAHNSTSMGTTNVPIK